MSASISINPVLTTNATGLFQTNSQGYTQGDAMDDPAVKFFLAGGVLSSAATTPLWPGLPIQELIPTQPSAPGTSGILGSTILQATTLANSTGISVMNQAYAAPTSPQSNAPLYPTGFTVNFYRFGSGARIPLPIDPTLVSLDGGLITQKVTWNFSTNMLVAYDSTNAFPVKILNISTSGNQLISYSSGTGFGNWTSTGALALCLI